MWISYHLDVDNLFLKLYLGFCERPFESREGYTLKIEISIGMSREGEWLRTSCDLVKKLRTMFFKHGFFDILIFMEVGSSRFLINEYTSLESSYLSTTAAIGWLVI